MHFMDDESNPVFHEKLSKLMFSIVHNRKKHSCFECFQFIFKHMFFFRKAHLFRGKIYENCKNNSIEGKMPQLSMNAKRQLHDKSFSETITAAEEAFIILLTKNYIFKNYKHILEDSSQSMEKHSITETQEYMEDGKLNASVNEQTELSNDPDDKHSEAKENSEDISVSSDKSQKTVGSSIKENIYKDSPKNSPKKRKYECFSLKDVQNYQEIFDLVKNCRKTEKQEEEYIKFFFDDIEKEKKSNTLLQNDEAEVEEQPLKKQKQNNEIMIDEDDELILQVSV